MRKNEVLKELRVRSGMSQDDLASKSGSTQPYINAIETNKSFSIKKSMELSKILNVDPDILIKAIEEDNITKKQLETEIEQPSGIITKTNQYITKSKSLIPFYNADFMAGKSEAYYEDGSSHPDYYMDVPEFYGCIAFRAFGDSMEPIIKSSSVLFGSKEDDDWMHSLDYGQIYGITMKNGRRYLKYVRKSIENPKTMFLLKSANPNYDDFEVRKDKVKNLWLIQGWIDKRA